MRYRDLLCTLLLSAAAAPLSAQHAVERHPLYDAASPTKETKATPATRLSLQAADSLRIAAEMKVPEAAENSPLRLKGWRGERVNTQLLLTADGEARQLRVSITPLRAADGTRELTARPAMIRYTKAHGKAVADIIGTETVCDHPAGIPRGIWVQADIPQDCPAGCYTGTLTVQAVGCAPISRELVIEVTEDVLPQPREWKMHVDFWQHPEAVARWHDVPAWSPEHLALMKPLMQRLADAGQKVITCALIDEAWNAQTYDWFPAQIRWIKGRDGQMRYDFSAFDTWVRFMMEEVGITEEIFCYTMVPWSMRVRYLDESSGTYEELPLKHDDPSYEAIWGHFLTAFRAHLEERGWLHKTSIALDERPDALVKATKRVLATYAPELRIVSSVDHPSEESKDIYLVSPVLMHADSLTPQLVEQRRAKGQKSIFYTCLNPKKPNSFTMSPPDESEWLGLFAAARHLDGYSRWAYNSWNRNPFETTDFVNWPSGDCFMVYPGNLSSVRFERLRDGFEDYEKIRILRERAAATDSLAAQVALEKLEEHLQRVFTIARSEGDSHTQDVRETRELIEKTAAATR